MFGKFDENGVLVNAPKVIVVDKVIDGRTISMRVTNPLADDLQKLGYKEVVDGTQVEVGEHQYKTIEYVDGNQIVVNEVLHDKIVHEAEEPTEELEDNRKMYVLVESETDTEVFKSYVVQDKPIEVQGEIPECEEGYHLEAVDRVCKNSIHRTYKAVANTEE